MARNLHHLVAAFAICLGLFSPTAQASDDPLAALRALAAMSAPDTADSGGSDSDGIDLEAARSQARSLRMETLLTEHADFYVDWKRGHRGVGAVGLVDAASVSDFLISHSRHAPAETLWTEHLDTYASATVRQDLETAGGDEVLAAIDAAHDAGSLSSADLAPAFSLLRARVQQDLSVLRKDDAFIQHLASSSQ